MSSFMVASVLAWVCLLRSRFVGVESAAHSHMLFSTECRSRLAPPLPAEYFGNCLRPCFMEATMELLMTSGGCGAIGLAIREMERGVLEGAEAEGWLGQVMSVLPQRPMSPSSSTTEHLTDIARVHVCQCVVTRSWLALVNLTSMYCMLYQSLVIHKLTTAQRSTHLSEQF